VVNSSGEIYAETAGGTIVLENVDPTSVDVGSTGGRVHYDGAFRPGGTYFFGAHGGSITIVVGEEARASFNVATVHGSITSNLSGTAQSMKGGERHQFEVGGGGAIVEAETYGGRIRILRRGSEGTAAPTRARNPNRDSEGLHLADRTELHEDSWGHLLGDEMSDDIDVAIAPAVAVAVSRLVDVALAPVVDVQVSASVAPAVAPALANRHLGRSERRDAPAGVIRR
jgi:hypothetical protein